MGIKDVTDALRLPTFANVNTGAAKANNRPGKNLGDKFRVTFTPQYKHLEATFVKLYGSLEPAGFDDVLFYHDTPDGALNAWMREYAAGGLMRKCDGENIVQEYSGKGTDYDFSVKTCLAQCACKPSGYLFFMLGHFTRATGVVGGFKLPTTSKNNIGRMASALNLAYGQYGTLKGHVFTLKRAKERIVKPVGDGRGMVDEWLVDLTLNHYDNAPAALPAPTTGTPQIIAGGGTPLSQRLGQFREWVYGQGLTDADVIEALGCAPEEYAGTDMQAADAVRAYVAKQI